MKIKLSTDERTEKAEERIDRKILEALKRRNKYWSAKALARRYSVSIEMMEHYMVEMAQKGLVSIGTDREGRLYVGSKEE